LSSSCRWEKKGRKFFFRKKGEECRREKRTTTDRACKKRGRCSQRHGGKGSYAAEKGKVKGFNSQRGKGKGAIVQKRNRGGKGIRSTTPWKIKAKRNSGGWESFRAAGGIPKEDGRVQWGKVLRVARKRKGGVHH